MAWVPWLGYLDWKYLEYSINSANCPASPIVNIFPLSLKKYWKKVQGMEIIRITIEVIWRSLGNCGKILWSLSFKVFPCKSIHQSMQSMKLCVEIHKSRKQLSKHKVQ